MSSSVILSNKRKLLDLRLPMKAHMISHRELEQRLAMFAIKSLVICDGEGKRIAAKYYEENPPPLKDQLVFERRLWTKSTKGKVDVIPLQNKITLYKGFDETYFYVTGGAEENELILYSVMNALVLSVSQLCGEEKPTKRGIFDRLAAVLLVLDEICDGGIILETDPQQIVRRIQAKGVGQDRISSALNEQSVSSVLQSGRKYFQDRLQKLREMEG